MRAAPSTDEPGRDTSSPPAQQAHLPGLLISSKDNSRPDSGLKDVTSPPALMAKQFASVPGLPITPADNAMALCNQSKLGPKHSPGLLDITVTSPKCLPPEKPGGDICLTYSSPRTTSYARATQSYETAEPTDQISQTAPESSGSGDGNYPAQLQGYGPHKIQEGRPPDRAFRTRGDSPSSYSNDTHTQGDKSRCDLASKVTAGYPSVIPKSGSSSESYMAPQTIGTSPFQGSSYGSTRMLAITNWSTHQVQNATPLLRPHQAWHPLGQAVNLCLV